MRFLTNENVPLLASRLLREDGYDIVAIPEEEPGTEDDSILARAAREERVVITYDRDYGELNYRAAMPSPPGVIYFRYQPPYPSEPAEVIRRLVEEELQFLGNFTIIERERIRQRPLP